MVKKVLISTIFEGYAVKQAILKLSIDKLILLVDEPKTEDKKNKMYDTIKAIKELFKDHLLIETYKISSYNIPRIMEEAIKIIDKEYKEENEIFIHNTEGRKITSLALLFAAFRKKEKIAGAYYITEEEHDLIKLPLIGFDINDTKKEILKEVSKGKFDNKELQKKLSIGQSAIYQNLQELKKEGYIENNGEFKITDLGRIMII